MIGLFVFVYAIVYKYTQIVLLVHRVMHLFQIPALVGPPLRADSLFVIPTEVEGSRRRWRDSSTSTALREGRCPVGMTIKKKGGGKRVSSNKNTYKFTEKIFIISPINL